MSSRTDPKSQKTCYQYDNLYCVTKVKYLCDAVGEYSVDYSYDADDNLIQMVDVSEGANSTTTYEYHDANNVTKITEPNGKYTEQAPLLSQPAASSPL